MARRSSARARSVQPAMVQCLMGWRPAGTRQIMGCRSPEISGVHGRFVQDALDGEGRREGRTRQMLLGLFWDWNRMVKLPASIQPFHLPPSPRCHCRHTTAAAAAGSAVQAVGTLELAGTSAVPFPTWWCTSSARAVHPLVCVSPDHVAGHRCSGATARCEWAPLVDVPASREQRAIASLRRGAGK